MRAALQPVFTGSDLEMKTLFLCANAHVILAEKLADLQKPFPESSEKTVVVQLPCQS
jgi:hypothetical protein